MRRARRINRALGVAYPDARCELDYSTPLELLVATILSAQCTDARVNQVTPPLFKRYPDAYAFASAKQADVEDLIMSTGFFRTKATNIIRMAQTLVSSHDGDVPRRLDDLVVLPGVGRKTANVVLGNAFGIPGITVDTHVGRLARRLGFTTHDDPVKVERDLMELFPKSEWTMLCHRLIFHGRRVCHARTPACGACPIAQWCPSFGEGVSDPARAKRLVKGPVVMGASA